MEDTKVRVCHSEYLGEVSGLIEATDEMYGISRSINIYIMF